MRILIIFFAIVLVATLKTSGASPTQREANMGQISAIIPVTHWDSSSETTAGHADPQIVFVNRSTKKPSKKKWFPKRWIFRPPMEPN